MAAKDSALAMLAQGLAPSIVAQTLGVEESYISQLMANEDFAAEVEEKRSATLEAASAYDRELDGAEEDALERVRGKLGFANLQQSLQAFKTLNGAKRRGDRHLGVGQNKIGTVVVINLPSVAVPKYITNGQNEIVEVEGQTMISATVKGLDALVAARKPKESAESVKMLEERQASQAVRALEMVESVRPVSRHKRKVPDVFTADML